MLNMNKYHIYTRPQLEVVKLQDARLHLRVDSEEEDTIIQSMLRAATLAAEQYCDRLFMMAKVDQFFDCFPGDTQPIRLYYPITDLISISYLDADNETQTVSTDDLTVDKYNIRGQIYTSASWPTPLSRVNAVSVKYNSGMCSDTDSIPSDIRHAVLLILGRLYEYREDTVSKLPTASQRLLDPYKLTYL